MCQYNSVAKLTHLHSQSIYPFITSTPSATLIKLIPLLYFLIFVLAFMKTTAASKRLMKELAAYNNNDEPDEDTNILSLEADDEDLFKWNAVVKGLKGTPYDEGRWKVEINIPQTYPLQPPTMKFLTPICHPNIHFKTGEVCLDILKDQWSPAWTITSSLMAVISLFSSPEPNSPLNIDIANLIRCGDSSASNGLIKYYKTRYAMKKL